MVGGGGKATSGGGKANKNGTKGKDKKANKAKAIRPEDVCEFNKLSKAMSNVTSLSFLSSPVSADQLSNAIESSGLSRPSPKTPKSNKDDSKAKKQQPQQNGNGKKAETKKKPKNVAEAAERVRSWSIHFVSLNIKTQTFHH